MDCINHALPLQWRYLTLACALIFEIHTITRPEYPFIVAKVLNPLLKSCTNHPHLLPFQTIILVRKLAVTVFIAISQLRPVLIPPETEESRLKHQMARLEKIAQTADGEATLLLATDMSPFAGDPTSLGDVKLKLKEWLVQNTIRADPEVRNAVGEVLKRKSANGPAGVRGML